MGGLYIDKNKVMIFGGKNADKKHNIKFFQYVREEYDTSSQNGEEVKIRIFSKNNSFIDENKFKFEYIQFFNNNFDYFYDFDSTQNDVMNKNAVCLLPNGDLIRYDLKKEKFFLKKFEE